MTLSVGITIWNERISFSVFVFMVALFPIDWTFFVAQYLCEGAIYPACLLQSLVRSPCIVSPLRAPLSLRHRCRPSP